MTFKIPFAEIIKTAIYEKTRTARENFHQILEKYYNVCYNMCGKHIYGLGLIGEEKECNVFKVYHFDYRGSTVAITDMYGNVTDRFEYDTYGKMVSHVGDSFVIFGYNGRDGVVTDKNGLIYMRTRYYSTDLRRFVNADVIRGEISNSVTLNRYAYANGNPVSNIDPFGLWGVFSATKNLISQGCKVARDWVVDTATPVNKAIGDGYNTVKNWIKENIVDPAAKIANNIKSDIQNFDWNNTDEQKVYESNYISAYKEKLVVRFGTNGRPGSVGILFINHAQDERVDRVQTLKHEYGHTKQLDKLGLIKYLLYVGIPSYGEWGSESYYLKPWEIIADMEGGVDIYNRPNQPTPTQENIDNGYEYMEVIENDNYSMLAKFLYIAHLRHIDDWLDAYTLSSTTNRTK